MFGELILNSAHLQCQASVRMVSGRHLEWVKRKAIPSRFLLYSTAVQRCGKIGRDCSLLFALDSKAFVTSAAVINF